jgi:phosphopantothenoylcysteine decarboxylase / phosphopantothenate---cysteine ligase
VQRNDVRSAAQMHDAVLAALPADVYIGTAAVADYTPRTVATHKLKKVAGIDTLTLELVRTHDVLADVAASPLRPRLVVGFAAETGDAEGDVLAHGRAKLARKGCDLLVVNEVGSAGHPTGFEGTQNAAVVLGADGSETPVPFGSKEALADVVWDLVAERLPGVREHGGDSR